MGYGRFFEGPSPTNWRVPNLADSFYKASKEKRLNRATDIADRTSLGNLGKQLHDMEQDNIKTEERRIVARDKVVKDTLLENKDALQRGFPLDGSREDQSNYLFQNVEKTHGKLKGMIDSGELDMKPEELNTLIQRMGKGASPEAFMEGMEKDGWKIGDAEDSGDLSDEERYGQNAVDILLSENPKASDAEQKKAYNAGVRERRRAQAGERGAGRQAEKEVDLRMNPKIAKLVKTNERLAEIETTAALLEAKGEITPVAKRDNAKKGVSGKLVPLTRHYMDLLEMNAIVDTESDSLNNMINAMRSSKMGQMSGKVFGTEAQSIRNKIKAIQPLLMNDIRQASEMGSRGMDSEKELEFYLKAATDPSMDFQSNMAAIAVLDSTYGDGTVAQELTDKVGSQYINNIIKGGKEVKNKYKDAKRAPQKALTYLEENPEAAKDFKAK